MTAKRNRIEVVLDRIRPLLRADGLDIELVEVRDDGASIRLTGFSSWWATAPFNIQTGLEETLRQEIERFGELRLVTDGDVPRPQPAEADLRAEIRVSTR